MSAKPYIDEMTTFKVHLPNILKEALNNEGASIMKIPFQILLGIMNRVAERALELNDPKLTALMCCLALYEQADPESKEYNPEMIKEVIDAANRMHASTLPLPVRKLRTR